MRKFLAPIILFLLLALLSLLYINPMGWGRKASGYASDLLPLNCPAFFQMSRLPGPDTSGSEIPAAIAGSGLYTDFLSESAELAALFTAPAGIEVGKCIAALQLGAGRKLSLLYILEADSEWSAETLPPGKSRMFGKTELRSLKIGEREWTYCLLEGRLLATSNPPALEQLLESRRNKEGLSGLHEYSRLQEILEYQPEAPKFYLNFYFLERLAPSLLSEQAASWPARMAGNMHWTALQMKLDSGRLRLNGNLILDPDGLFSKAYLGKAESGVELPVPVRDGQPQLVLNNYRADRLPGGDGMEYLRDWLGSHISFFPAAGENSLIASISDSALAAQNLAEYQSFFSESAPRSDEAENIHLLSDTALLDRAFPQTFHDWGQVYYHLDESHWLVSENKSRLLRMIESLKDARTNERKSDAFLRLKLGRDQAADWLTSLFRFDEGLPHFNELELSLFATGSDATIEASVDFERSAPPTDKELWQQEFESPLIAGPIPVLNHESGSTEFIVQDAGFQLHLLDMNGEIRWSKPLSEPLVGEAVQIDFYENGKLQLFFCTEGNLHLLDRLGRPVADFPVRLPASTSTGMRLVYYEDSKQYRIFVACSNAKVYGYELSGRPLEGWHPKEELGMLTEPIHHRIVRKKDHLIAVNDSGEIHILDRRGKLRNKVVRTTWMPAEPSVIVGDRTYYQLILQQSGKLLHISNKGKVLEKEYTAMDSSAQFRLLENWLELPEIALFRDGQRLLAFDAATAELVRQIDLPVGGELQLQSAQESGLLLVYSPPSGKLWLYDRSLELLPQSPLECKGRFNTLKDSKSGESFLLLESAEGVLRAYPLLLSSQ